MHNKTVLCIGVPHVYNDYYIEGTLSHSKNSLFKTAPPPCIILRGHFCIANTIYAKLSPMYYIEGYCIEGTLLHSRKKLCETVSHVLY